MSDAAASLAVSETKGARDAQGQAVGFEQFGVLQL